MRYAVLDTNILVSAVMRPEGPPGLVLAAVKRGELVPVFNPAILSEYDEVLRRPRLGLGANEIADALEAMRALGVVIEIAPTPPPAHLPDDADWPFIACALVAGCPVITGNVKHFPVEAGVRVLTARGWAETAG